MKPLLIALILFLLAVPATAQDTLMGKVTHVRDGDTIELAGVAVRLNGVAAPELDEPVGQEAKRYMHELVAGETVRCDLNGERSYDRVIGVCFIDGEDIGEMIINAGLARDCPRFSGGRYDAFNTEASRKLPLPGYCEHR